MSGRFSSIGACVAVLMVAGCADTAPAPKRLPPGEAPPADIEAAPPVSRNPFVPQAAEASKVPAFSDQVDGDRYLEGSVPPRLREPMPASRGSSAPVPVVPAPGANPADPEVVARRGAAGLIGTRPGDPTAQIVGSIGQGSDAGVPPPPQGQFSVVGPGEAGGEAGDGTAPLPVPPQQ